MLSGRLARALIRASLAVSAAVASTAGAAAPQKEPSSEVVAIRGRIVCLDALAPSTAAPGSDPCNQPGARFEIHGVEHETVPFVAGDPKTDIFTDPQVRERQIEVRGWRRSDGFEILSVYAVQDGALHHLHYRCDVCNITTYAPGPCWCCGQPFELREGPAGGSPPPEGQ
jgi:hypothetical protein